MNTDDIKNYFIGALLGSAGAGIYNMLLTKNPAGPMADLSVSFQMFKDGQWMVGAGMSAPMIAGAVYYSNRYNMANAIPLWAETIIAGAATKALVSFMFNR